MHLQLVPLCLAVSLLSACTTWTPQQKAKLDHIMIEPATAVDSAYREADPTAAPGFTVIGALTGQGPLPVLVGGVMDLGVMTFQQVKFELSESKHFEDLKQTLKAPPTAELAPAVREVLNVDPFFRTRLADTAPAKLSLRIVKYGLARSPIHDDDVLLRVSIEAEVKITVGSEVLFSDTFIGRGKRAASAGNILKDPGYVAAGYREAAQDLAAQLVVALDKKVGRL